ncbi:hypothetical protein CAPTEDRAFT_206518 [Capitella teleta]|uniref:Uncharacterized protein n=1 Tax=Capitella teleta TaxID=283909 RepID=R7U8B6_CAPTE|nr:hypothetical protein CAPTEDRAFT_206518 [Capitella teleta]|eukprot:ELT99916.1 hypothetical protein CAPTEDRAFT_206518 [Capitella teleta]
MEADDDQDTAALCKEMKPTVSAMKARFETKKSAETKGPPLPSVKPKQSNGSAAGATKPPTPTGVEVRDKADSLLVTRPSSRETMWPPPKSPASDASGRSSTLQIPAVFAASTKPPVNKPKPVLKPKPTNETVSPPVKSATSSPVKAPVSPPAKAPVSPPAKAPVSPAVKAPVSPAVKEPTCPPVTSPVSSKANDVAPGRSDDNNNTTDTRKPPPQKLDPFVTHEGKRYKLISLIPKAGKAPSKPSRPKDVDLESFFEENDEELYDDIGDYQRTTVPSVRQSTVSQISTYDSENEDEDGEDEILYDTVGADPEDEGEELYEEL